jgi:hypothetical protein
MSHASFLRATRTRALREGVLDSAVGVRAERESSSNTFTGTWTFTDLDGYTKTGLTFDKATLYWVMEIGRAAARFTPQT